MPKWIDLNNVDDETVLKKNNPLIRSLEEEELRKKARLEGGDVDYESKPLRTENTESVSFSQSFAGAMEDDFLDVMEPAKKSMTIFFLIDVSGSMKGTKIGSLNSTMEELLPSLIGVGEASTDVKVAVMKFSTEVEWVTPSPVRIEEYQYWNRLEANGLTFMGDAFVELNKKLSRNAFLNSPSVSYAPVIFLLSDGAPNDDWKKGLKSLQGNRWFTHALKIALGIGSEVDMDVLRAFTGNDDLAVQAKTADQLRELIKLMAVTSSQIGSRSLALVDNTSGGGRSISEQEVSLAKQQVLVEEIRMGARDILGEAVDIDSVNYDEGW